MKDIDQTNLGVEQREHIPAHHDIWFFFKKQSVPLYLITAVFALVAFVYVFYTVKTNRDNEQASRLLGAAQTSKQFEELVQQYPKSAVGPVALLALASSYFSAGAYDAALARYVEFAEKYPKHPMLSAAELGKVMCSEARGEIEKALMEFNAFLQTYPDHFLTPQALFGKARCLQATGKLTEARIVYENFVAAHPESKWRQQAEWVLQSLDRQARLNSRGRQGQ